MSVNVPFLLFRYSRFGCVSLARNTSGHPSPFTSNTPIPSALLFASAIPAFFETSSNVPFPRLRYNFGGTPLYDSGVQYDFVFPSIEQNRSPFAVHCT